MALRMRRLRKPTTLVTSDPVLAELVEAWCPGCPYHLPLERSSPGIGNRASEATIYQPKMYKYLAIAIYHFLLDQVYTADDSGSHEAQEQSRRAILNRFLPKNTAEA